MHGHLEVVIGPMYAGKTERLIAAVHAAEAKGLRALVIKPALDSRNQGSSVTSHGGKVIEALTLPVDGSGMPLDRDVLAIDEIQFFTPAIIPCIAKAVGRGVGVIVAGLDYDSFGKPFGPVPDLVGLADAVTRVAGTCAKCGDPSTRSQRLYGGAGQILVGGAGMYEPRCCNCFTPHTETTELWLTGKVSCKPPCPVC